MGESIFDISSEPNILNMKLLIPIFVILSVGFCTVEDSLLSKAAKWYGDEIHEQLKDSKRAIDKDATTIKCYYCHSMDDEDPMKDFCADEDDLEDQGEAAWVDCSGTCVYIFGEYKDQEVHIRGCNEDNLPIVDDCLKVEAEKQDGKAHVCVCSSDLCNSTQRFGLSGIFGVIVLLVSMRFQYFMKP